MKTIKSHILTKYFRSSLGGRFRGWPHHGAYFLFWTVLLFDISLFEANLQKPSTFDAFFSVVIFPLVKHPFSHFTSFFPATMADDLVLYNHTGQRGFAEGIRVLLAETGIVCLLIWISVFLTVCFYARNTRMSPLTELHSRRWRQIVSLTMDNYLSSSTAPCSLRTGLFHWLEVLLFGPRCSNDHVLVWIFWNMLLSLLTSAS